MIPLSVEIPVDWSTLGQDDGDHNHSECRDPVRAEQHGEAAVWRYGQGGRRCGTGDYGDRWGTAFGRGSRSRSVERADLREAITTIINRLLEV